MAKVQYITTVLVILLGTTFSAMILSDSDENTTVELA